MRALVLLTEPDHSDRWAAADDDHRERCFRDYRAFSTAVRQRGTLVAGDALDAPSTARTVRPGDGRSRSPGQGRPVTEGPFAEPAEQLGGFYLIEVPDLDTAVELAALLPRELTVEVRPTLEVEV